MINNRRVMKINAWVQNNCLELLSIILVAINLVRIMPQYLDLSDFWRSYILNYYVLSYQTAGGFVSRGLVGTILDIFVDTINSKIFYGAFVVLYFTVYSFIILLLLKKAKKSTEPYLLSALILMLMFSPAITNYACDFARPDIFLVIITLLCMHLIAKNQFLFFIPILCVMGICIHEGFVCFFMPIIGITFLIKVIQKKSLNNILWFFVTIFLTLITFSIIFRYGKTNVTDVDTLFNLIQSKIDIALNRNMIDFEFGSMKETLWEVSYGELSTYTTLLELIFYFALFFPIYYIYVRILNTGKIKIQNCFIRVLYMIAPFSGLLMIIVGVDYGRWFSLSITACCIHLFYFVKMYSIDVVPALKICNKQKAIFVFFMVALMYITIGPMGDIHEHFEYLVSFNNLITYFWH